MHHGQATAELLLSHQLHQTTQFYSTFSVLSSMPKKKKKRRLSCYQNVANLWHLMEWGDEDPLSFYLNAWRGSIWCRASACKKHKLSYGMASKKDQCPAFCHEGSTHFAVPIALPVFLGKLLHPHLVTMCTFPIGSLPCITQLVS